MRQTLDSLLRSDSTNRVSHLNSIIRQIGEQMDRHHARSEFYGCVCAETIWIEEDHSVQINPFDPRKEFPTRFLRFLAPELLTGSPWSVASDTYSLAVTVFEIFTGKLLFRGADREDLLRQKRTPPDGFGGGGDLTDFFAALSPDPQVRPPLLLYVASAWEFIPTVATLGGTSELFGEPSNELLDAIVAEGRLCGVSGEPIDKAETEVILARPVETMGGSGPHFQLEDLDLALALAASPVTELLSAKAEQDDPAGVDGNLLTVDPRTNEAVRVERALDLALFDRVPVYVPMELIGFIRLSGSDSLGQLLDSDGDSELRAKHVRSHILGVDLWRDAFGRLQSADVTIRVTAPDFKPRVQKRIVRIYPERDSERQTFLLIPQHTGNLRVQFEVLQAGRTVVSRVLKTQSNVSDRMPEEVPRRVVITVPLDVRVDPQKPQKPWLASSVVAALLMVSIGLGYRYFEPDFPARQQQSPVAQRALLDSRPFTKQARLALVVGISNYPSSSQFPSLKYAANDAEAIADVLRRIGYEQVAILRDREASKTAILEWLDTFGTATSDGEGTIIFYFGGHGLQIDREQYLVSSDAIGGDVKRTALSMSELGKKLDAIKAPRKMVFLDACRNQLPAGQKRSRGIFDTLERLQTLSQSKGIRIMNATGSNEYSYEDDTLTHGIFTCALLNALEGDAVGPDGLITFADVFNTTARLMATLSIKTGTRQSPWEGGDANGDMLLADRTAQPRRVWCGVRPVGAPSGSGN